MKEIFKDVIGFEGRYEVSNTGLVRGVSSRWGKRESPIYLRQLDNGHGYFEVRLFENGKAWRKTVHRLVAEAFIPNLKNKELVNHIDGNKWYNNLENLEWATRKENAQHAIKMGLSGAKGETNHNAKLSDMDVRNLRHLNNIGVSQVKLADFFGINKMHVNRIVNNKVRLCANTIT